MGACTVALSDHPLDRRSVVEGALLALAVAVPPIGLIVMLRGGELAGEESNAWLLVPVALLVGFALGGYRAGSTESGSPLTNAAAGGGLAFAAITLYSLIRRAVASDPITFEVVVRMVLLAQICTSTALLGGYVAYRRRARA
jgi:hypothetical protein